MFKTYIQERQYLKGCTISDLYTPENENIGYALEDVGRPPGVKIKGETCIPEFVYDVSITYSNRFKKDMILLSNNDRGTVTDSHGVEFTGIRVHGGNDVDDTDGCPCIAKNFDGEDEVWDSLSSEVTEQLKQYIKEGHVVKWIITRKQ